jgi:hypothetical protein
MDGNNMEETQYLWQKAVDFADCVRTGFLSRQDATYALHRTIMKTLEYPMVTTTMDKLQWDYIMAPILQATLPRMGYVCNLPQDVAGVLATISRTRDGVRITGVNPLTPGGTNQAETTPCSIRAALDLRKKLDKWSVQSADVVDNGRSIAAAIIRGSARAVSDGSFKNVIGTSASILFH